jgi:hypothetical protein
VADIPDSIVLRRHRDLVGRRHEIWIRRGILLLLTAVLALALADQFGQRPSTSRDGGLSISAPARVRGGLLYQARFRVHADHELKRAALLLSSGWLNGMTINTIEPSPVGESSRNGDLLLTLGHVPSGRDFVLYIQFQVNPTTVGARTQIAELYDRSTLLARIHRRVYVFP